MDLMAMRGDQARHPRESGDPGMSSRSCKFASALDEQTHFVGAPRVRGNDERCGTSPLRGPLIALHWI
jgi:hypothetical protein